MENQQRMYAKIIIIKPQLNIIEEDYGRFLLQNKDNQEQQTLLDPKQFSNALQSKCNKNTVQWLQYNEELNQYVCRFKSAYRGKNILQLRDQDCVINCDLFRTDNNYINNFKGITLIDCESTIDKMLGYANKQQMARFLLDNDPNVLNRGPQIIQNVIKLQSIIQQEDEDQQFAYQYPPHLLPHMQGLFDQIDPHSENIKQFLYDWFQTEVIQSQMDGQKRRNKRGKALVLYSQNRCIGKTSFGRLICGEDLKQPVTPSVLLVRNKLNKQCFNDADRAKILILDDMQIPQIQDIEMWKALVTSEPTTIRQAYCNIQFKGGLPVIITTNNEQLFNFFTTHPDFKYDTNVVNLRNDRVLLPPDMQKQIIREQKHLL